MAFPVTLNGRTYTLADFEGTNYVDGLPDAFEDFVTHAGDIYNTTSTSSVAIGTGSKSFTTADSDKPYQAGTPLRIADAAAPETNFMDAIVTSYSGTSLVVDVFGYAGSGTKTSWTINIGGAKTVDGTLAVAQGGTGATSAADARTNLDVYSKADADSRFLNVSGEASNVTMTGDVTIGDTSADTLTVNATASFSSDLAVDTNTLYVDSTNNRVGIGTSSPSEALTVSGSGTSARISLTDSDSVRASMTGFLEFDGTDDRAGFIGYDAGNMSLYAAVGDIKLSTGGAARLTIDETSGNVGIGESDPNHKVEISGSGATARLALTRTDTNTVGGVGSIQFNALDGHALAGISVSGDGNDEGAHIDFRTTSAATDDNIYNVPFRMRLDSSGDLLVGGTTSSTSRIKITGDGGVYTNYSMLLEAGSEDNAYHGISLMTPGNALGGIIGSNYELNATTVSQSNTGRSSGYIAFENTTVAGKTSNIVFGGVVKGTAVNVPRMMLNNDGNLLVGTTSTSSSSGDGFKVRPNLSSITGYTNVVTTGSPTANAQSCYDLYSTGASSYRFYVGYGGTIHATSTSITAISDESLKENIRDLDKGLDTINALQPRRFDWKNGDGNDIMGFVAQEVEEVMPELVHEYKYSDEETKLGLKMGDMLPSMVKAIQELSAQVNELKAEVAALKGA